MPAPLITVVVCTRNRCESLRAALQSLMDVSTDGRFRYEVLVVDNGSTDATQAVVASIAAVATIPVRSVIEAKPGIVPARNRGVHEARGAWIAFFDDDQLADSRWLLELFIAATTHGCRCVGGAVDLHLPSVVRRNLSPICRMLLGETIGMPKPRQYNDRVTPGCGNLMVHRSVFDEIGLFDPRKTDRGEDTDLFLRMRRAGIDGWYTPAALVHHCIPAERLSDTFLLNLSRRMAAGMAVNERKTWGAWRYPAIWITRLAQAAGVLLPRLLLAALKHDHEAALGARCRLRIALDSLRNGWHLMSRFAPVDPASSADRPHAGRKKSVTSWMTQASDRFAILECAVARAEDCRAEKPGLRSLFHSPRSST